MVKFLSDYNYLSAAFAALIAGGDAFAGEIGAAPLALKPPGEAIIPVSLVGDFAAGERELAALSEGERENYFRELRAGESETNLSARAPVSEGLFALITGDAGASDGGLFSALVA